MRTAQAKHWNGAQFVGLDGWYGRFNQFVDANIGRGLKYLVGQDEICPTTGRHHVQWCLGFEHKVTYKPFMSSLWLLAGEQGDHSVTEHPDSMFDYCQAQEKDGKPKRMPNGQVFVFGARPQGRQGERTDLNLLHAMVKQNTLAGIISHKTLFENPLTRGAAIKFQTGVKAMQKAYKPDPPRRTSLKTRFCYGPAGVGKTACVHEGLPANHWTGLYSGEFYIGVEGCTHGIMEEFDGSGMPYPVFLNLFDVVPALANVKHNDTGVNLLLTDLRVSGNKMPEEWWEGKKKPDAAARDRRFKLVHYHFVQDRKFWIVEYEQDPDEHLNTPPVWAMDRMRSDLFALSMAGKDVRAAPLEWFRLNAKGTVRQFILESNEATATAQSEAQQPQSPLVPEVNEVEDEGEESGYSTPLTRNKDVFYD